MKNNVRANAIKQIKEGLVICNETLDMSLYDYSKISESIETEIYIQSGNDSSAKCYRDKIKELLMKMKKDDFDYYKKAVLSSTITANEFTSKQLINADNNKNNAKDNMLNKSPLTKGKRVTLIPPKVKFHSRSHSTSTQIDDNNSKSNIKTDMGVIEQVEKKERNEDQSSLSKDIIKSEYNQSNNVQEKSIAIEENYLMYSNEVQQIRLLDTGKNEPNYQIPVNKEQLSASDDNKQKKKVIESINQIKPSIINKDLKTNQLSDNNLNKNLEEVKLESPKQFKVRHHSLSTIHSISSNKENHNHLSNIKSQLLELQIVNMKSESKCLLYEKEIESLRKEILLLKEQNLGLTMKNLQFTTELQMKSDTILKQKNTIESQNNILSQYDKNYSNLKTKVETNSNLLEKQMNKFMIDFSKLSNKFDTSSLSKLDDVKQIDPHQQAKPNNSIKDMKDMKDNKSNNNNNINNNKPHIDLFASTDNELTFSMLINKN